MFCPLRHAIFPTPISCWELVWRHMRSRDTSRPLKEWKNWLGPVFKESRRLLASMHGHLYATSLLSSMGLPKRELAVNKRRPNHNHDHFWAHLAAPDFSILGYPWMLHQNPFYTVEHKENSTIFHLMCHQVPFWCDIRCNLLKLWLWLWLGHPWVKEGKVLSRTAKTVMKASRL